MSVADLSVNQRTELARWLNEFPPPTEDNDDPEQYWFSLADHLRRTHRNQFDYTNLYLVTIGGKQNPALYLLGDLATRKLDLVELVTCLKVINCEKGLNIFRNATPPVISQQPTQKHVVVKSGETIVVSIEASCQPGRPKYQWFKYKEPVVGQVTSTLTIKSANAKHSGYYCCRVQSPFINDLNAGSVFSEFVNVEVVGGNNDEHVAEGGKSYPTQETGDLQEHIPLPRITLHPSPVTVRLGEQVTLECTAERGELYDWYKDGKAHKLSCTRGLLEISSVKSSDSGMYYCVAVNNGGKVESKKAKITVESGIIIEEEPKDVSIRLSGEVELKCVASNVYGAQMKYTWYQKGKADSVGDGQVYRTKLSRTRHDEIKFYCLVSLVKSPEISARSRSAVVTIDTLWITQQPRSVQGTIDGRIVLSCKAEGRGNITYMWLKSVTMGGHKKIIERNDGILAFSKLAQEHWGYYVCQAENPYQFVDSKEVRLSVHLPGALDRRRKRALQPPLIRILKHPWSQVVPQNSKFRVLCEAVCTKDEPLHYQWYRNTKAILGAIESSYTRPHATDSDYGTYYCVVRTNTNKASDVSKTARIERASTASLNSPTIVGKSGTQVRKEQAEQEQITLANERFARMKVALLIGNQRYQKMTPLLSPENDIRELRTLLENELDFKVISLVNLTHTEMMQALEKFYELLSIAGIYALFYYSGHGFTGQNRDYLVPVDAELPLRRSHNINVEGIIKQMQNKLSKAIVVLDCCRVAEENMIFDISSEGGAEAPVNRANYILISSCMRYNPAYDSASEPNSASSDQFQRGGGPPAAAPVSLASPTNNNGSYSYFNIAFRDALTHKGKDVYKVFQHVSQMFKGSLGDQVPEIRGNLEAITFHDAVMMDDEKNEDKLNKIMETYEQVHTVPEPYSVKDEDLGILAGLVRVELCFLYDFSNVLCVETNLCLCTDKATTAKVTYDLNFIEELGVTGEQSSCEPSSQQQQSNVDEDDEGAAEGEGETFFTTTLTVSSVQRLGKKKKLNLVFTVTVQVEGEDKSVSVCYELPQKPLFASILHV